MLRRLNRKSRISSSEAPIYTPEPKYAVQPDEEKRRSTSSSQEKTTRQLSSGEIVQVDDETSMTLEEIKLKRKVSVSQSGKVHKKSSRNSVVDIFGDKDQAQQWDDSEGSRQPRNSSDLQF